MLFECGVITLCAQLRQSGRRVLDVAEEECDGAGGVGGYPDQAPKNVFRAVLLCENMEYCENREIMKALRPLIP